MVKRMKKLFLLLLTVFMVSLFVGCSNTTETTTLPKLDTPSNLAYDGLLTWDAVDHATSYEVHLGSMVYLTDQPYYTPTQEGSFDAVVVAKADGYMDSDPSDALTINVQFYDDNVQFDIYFSDTEISWNEVADATSYNIFVNGETYTSDTFTLSATELPNGLLSISVQAVYPIGVSNISDSYYYLHNMTEGRKISIHYSMNSTQDAVLWSLPSSLDFVAFDHMNQVMDKSFIFSSYETSLAVSADYLAELELGVHSVYIASGDTLTEVEITITDKTDPYIISMSSVYTDGSKDIKFQFELFGGSVYSISGNAEDTVLYDVNDNIVTIQSSFIQGKFDSTDNFILSYALNKGDRTIIGYLFFNKE